MSGGTGHPDPTPHRVTYRVEVDRVRVHGADAGALDAHALRVLVESAVIREAQRMPLPAGRTVRASVQLPARPVTGGAQALADAVGEGVARAIGGGPGHG